MSLFDSIASVFYPTDDALAQGRALDAKAQALVIPDYQPGGASYEKIKAERGEDSANKAAAQVLQNFQDSQADALDAKGQQIYDDTHERDSGLGKLLKDVLVLAVVGAATWAFFKFGGMAALQRLSAKYKWAPWAIGAATIVGAWLIYRKVKETGADASNVGDNFGKNLTTILS